jgi:hypothetical protein
MGNTAYMHMRERAVHVRGKACIISTREKQNKQHSAMFLQVQFVMHICTCTHTAHICTHMHTHAHTCTLTNYKLPTSSFFSKVGL